MKKVFSLSLVVIITFTLVMGCATTKTKDKKGKEAPTMTKGGNITLKVTVNEATGEVVSVTDESGNNKATRLTQKELEEIYRSSEGFRYAGVILHTHSSPNCITYLLGGWALKICY